MSALTMRSLLMTVVLTLCLSVPAWAQQEDGLLPRESPAPEILEPAKPEPVITKPALPNLNLETPDTGTGKSSAIDPKDIPEILMREVNEIEKSCNYNTLYAAYHDCRCIAVKFLDARLNSDPDRSRDAIYQKVSSECPNEPGIAGFIYKGCTEVMQYARPKDFDKFCSCSANDVARSYTARPNMNMRYIEGLRKRAYIRCGVAEQPDYNSPYRDAQ